MGAPGWYDCGAWEASLWGVDLPLEGTALASGLDYGATGLEVMDTYVVPEGLAGGHLDDDGVGDLAVTGEGHVLIMRP